MSSTAGDMSRRNMLAFGVFFVATFMMCISQSMLINALPSILTEFDINAGYGQLLTTGYIFTLGLISAMTAALVDRYSTRMLSILSSLFFIIGCIVAVFSTTFTTLFIGRLLQAGGAGISLPLLQDVALIIYPKERYGQAMGLLGVIIGFAPALGPAIAGPIIDLLGWRAIFVILGSCMVLTLILTLIFLDDLSEHRDTRFNILSALLYCAGLIAIMFGLTHAENEGIGHPASFVPILAGIVVLIVYVRRDLRSESPLLHLGAFRSRRFTVDCMLVVFGQISMMVASIMVPLYIQGVQYGSATASGLTIMPGAILLGVLNPVTGRLYDRFGARALAVSGCAFILVGTVAFIFCTASSPAWVIVLLYGLRTVGIACVWMPLTADASLALPPQETTQATAITTSMRQLFAAMFSTVFVSIMAACTTAPSGISDHGFDVSFTVLSVLTAAMLVVAALFIKNHRKDDIAS